jgi:hypothetical protein
MCSDIRSRMPGTAGSSSRFLRRRSPFILRTKNVACTPIDEQRWGSITRITLPGGGKIGVYQPKHPSPLG